MAGELFKQIPLGRCATEAPHHRQGGVTLALELGDGSTGSVEPRRKGGPVFGVAARPLAFSACGIP